MPGIAPVFSLPGDGMFQATEVGSDHNGQVTCWHEMSGGERVMSGEFTLLLVFWPSFGHFCSLRHEMTWNDTT